MRILFAVHYTQVCGLLANWLADEQIALDITDSAEQCVRLSGGGLCHHINSHKL